MSIFEWPMERYVLLAIVVCCGWTAVAMRRWDRRHPQPFGDLTPYSYEEVL